MKKKSIVCGVLASSIAVAATLGGCSLVSTNTAADMNQVVAVVDISNSAALDKEFENCKDAVGSTSIIKRELVAYFINYGYSVYQQNNSYEETFNYLLDQLIDNAVLVQYSTMYLLYNKASTKNDKGEVVSVDDSIIATYKSKGSDKEKYEYLLDAEDINIASYNLYYMINSAIDSREKDILKEETSSNGTDTRTTPDGVDAQKENYYPSKDGKLDYGIYTGYKTVDKDGEVKDYRIDNSGAYKKDKLEGTTNATRIKAYNEFISNLTSSSYDLVDAKTENLSDVLSLNYIQYEYVNQLQQRIINKYYKLYEDELNVKLTADDYAYIKAEYEDKIGSQTESYKTESNFTSDMDSMSDTSFILYAPDTEDTEGGGKFGFVYNILLPFSDSQNDALKALQSLYADEDLDGGYTSEYYVERNKLLSQIQTTDQRAAWFNGETDYAFKATDGIDYYDNGKNSSWLFFENNVSNRDKYEALDKYAGLYPYNGKVVKRDDDYILSPNKLSINGDVNGTQSMLDEFVAYIDHVMKNDKGTTTYDKAKINNYGKAIAADGEALYTKVNGKDVIDYSNFVYTTGKVNFGENKTEEYNRANLLWKESKQYAALSAVNELQYAYTTDTGVLSQYLGYSVQAGDTSYIKEFEYAAHLAIAGDENFEGGAGSYVVCAGDYGWHLIYVTYTFDAGKNQYDPQWDKNIDKEGTFENLFYEWYKSKNLSNISTTRKNKIITDFKLDSTVTKHESAYKNLFELDKKN
ncbi:MAG: hypothetical protein K2K38_01455 [Clostridia bacterium]|nr:hypothetical protein [Clostridia bacterium]